MDKLLVPEFLLNFNCIGSQCEDTCCHEWEILIDKNTYYTYKKSKNKLIKEKFNSSVGLNGKSNNDGNYAKIVLDDNKRCAFLNKDKLCLIHSELGPESLCYTCKIYPRIYNKVGQAFEESLSLSCPEVARLALLNRNKMSFTEIDINVKFETYCTNTVNKNEDIFWLLRMFTIDVLQNRNFELWERLALLGVFFEQSSNFIEEDKKSDLISIIDSFNLLLDTEEVHNILNSLNKNDENQFNILNVFYQLAGFKNTIQVFEELCMDFHEGLLDTDEREKISIHKYNKNYEDYYKIFIQKYEHIFENYLVHYVFTNLFPTSKIGNAYDEYCVLVLNYVLIKGYLIGISGKYKMIDEELTIKLIHSYSRNYAHGNNNIQNIYKVLKNKKMMTLENIISLMNN
ncbi:lysine-N-methylase [Clostridium punense]|uniref:Lysine-N-methylase n=1 Tax=Clostridium punense TaxID=1054297 RepID=A0ABS4K3V9_9CLOT|nr:flagellin lysine-N-methylase [Clostridium punense]MBP2021811.1 lysine-N-methylase [Clostridium punense]